MPALDLLRDLLRLDTTNPPGNEGPAAERLSSYLEDAGVTTTIETSPGGRHNLVARIEGPRERPALVLLSHTDVVGVEHDRWSKDPFGGETASGAIWGRGALDMKGIAALHAEAVARLARSGRTPTREVIFCSVADEEAGGSEGARFLIEQKPEIVGFTDAGPPEVLGEGAFGLSGVVDRPLMPIVMGEKSSLWIDLIARGEPGHGSLPPADQAVLNLARVVQKVSGYKTPHIHPVMQEQFAILARETGGARSRVFKALASRAGSGVASALAKPLRASGAIAALLSDTITPTQINAGYKHNVVPGEARASLDCRLLPDTDVNKVLSDIKGVAERKNVSVEVAGRHRGPVSSRGPLYSLIEQVSAGLPSHPVVVPSLTPGFTDVRFFRDRGATGYGWVPFVLAPELLATVHGHDERVPLKEFEAGVEAMSEVVARACST